MFSQQLVNGITLGSTYALIAIGYTLVLGDIVELNLAHGELFMVGTFAGIGMAAAGAPVVKRRRGISVRGPGRGCDRAYALPSAA